MTESARGGAGAPSQDGRSGAAALFRVEHVFHVRNFEQIALTGHVEAGVIQVGDSLTLRGSSARVEVEGMNFPGPRATDKSLVALLISGDTNPVPAAGDYLEGP